MLTSILYQIVYIPFYIACTRRGGLVANCELHHGGRLGRCFDGAFERKQNSAIFSVDPGLNCTSTNPDLADHHNTAQTATESPGALRVFC